MYHKFRQEVNVDMNFEGDYVCEQVLSSLIFCSVKIPLLKYKEEGYDIAIYLVVDSKKRSFFYSQITRNANTNIWISRSI